MPTQQQLFVKTTAIVGTPSDSNDGKDPLGLALTTATWVAATRTLTQAAKFGNVLPGDLLTITGGTNADIGTYTVESVPSQDSCVLTESLAGIDLSTGDIKSSNGPYATLQAVLTAGLAAGDTLNVCNDGVQEPTDTVVWAAPTNTVLATPWVRGCNARGQWKPGEERAIVSSEGLPTTKDLLHITIAKPFVRFSDLLITGSPNATPPTGGKDLIRADGSNGHITFDRVDITYSHQHGVTSQTSTTLFCFNNCGIYWNNGWGLMSGFNGAGNFTGYQTVVAFNGRDAAWVIGGAGGVYAAGRQGAYGSPGLWVECMFHHNGGPGIVLFANDGYEYGFAGCHFDNNGAQSTRPGWTGGILGDGSAGSTLGGGVSIANTNMSNNTGYGIALHTLGQIRVVDRLNFWQNTLGDCNLDLQSIAPGEFGHFDPQFLSLVEGQEDYRMADASPLQTGGIGCRTS